MCTSVSSPILCCIACYNAMYRIIYSCTLKILGVIYYHYDSFIISKLYECELAK